MIKVDYTYNIRGWLTDINNTGTLLQSGAPQDLFAFRIHYNSVTNDVNGAVKPLYNGNIAETFWRTSGDNIRRKYGYTYDYQNRLLDAWYQIPGTAVPLIESYNEHLTYDKNGNILTLQRNGDHEVAGDPLTSIDELMYDYDPGNRLVNVIDGTNHPSGFEDGNQNPNNDPNLNDFDYDDFGNLIEDRNKGITEITYNHLHLPKQITFGSDGTIEYLYDANGTKLKKQVTDNTENPIVVKNTHYMDGFQYVDGKMEFFPHAEGYVKYTEIGRTSFYSYVYNYTDHLGNIRLRYTVDPATDELAILEEDHYYPFGLKHTGYNSAHNIIDVVDGISNVVIVPVSNIFPDTYKYKFGGMEYQDEFNVNMYDFGARNYDPALGRWMNIDPLAEQMRRHSPYNYAFNNPIFFIDPDGMAPEGLTNSYGMSLASAAVDYSGPSFNVSTVGKDNKVLDTKNVASLDGVGYDKGGEIFTDRGNTSSSSQSDAGGGDCPPNCDLWDVIVNTLTSSFRSTPEQLSNKARDVDITKKVIDETERHVEAIGTMTSIASILYPSSTTLSLATKAPALVKSAYTSFTFGRAFQISNPNALSRTLPGYTDNITNSLYRQGRGSLLDYATQKPPLMSYNTQNFSTFGRWVTGVGLSGAAGYYYYKKMMPDN